MIWLVLFLTLPTAILAATFERALLKHEPLVLLTALTADVLANYGGLALLFYDSPRRGEWTFSKHLPRLCDLPGWRGRLARRCKIYINSKVPGHIT